MPPVTAPTQPTSQGDETWNWVKADLHLHTSEDPFDEIDYSALEIVERAHALGYRVLAVTLHEKVFDDPATFARAAELGLRLIPAAELRIEGADAVVLNLSREEAAAVRSFDDLRALRAARGNSLLVLAPHPYYRFGGSIGRRIEQHLDCFDAVEHCHFHVPLFNPNRAAARLARRHGWPLLATSDCHHRRFFGTHYSSLGLAPATDGTPPTLESVFDAIRAHRVRRVAPSGGWRRLAALLWFIFVQHPYLGRQPGSKRRRAREADRRGPDQGNGAASIADGIAA